ARPPSAAGSHHHERGQIGVDSLDSGCDVESLRRFSPDLSDQLRLHARIGLLGQPCRFFAGNLYDRRSERIEKEVRVAWAKARSAAARDADNRLMTISSAGQS